MITIIKKSLIFLSIFQNVVLLAPPELFREEHAPTEPIEPTHIQDHRPSPAEIAARTSHPDNGISTPHSQVQPVAIKLPMHPSETESTIFSKLTDLNALTAGRKSSWGENIEFKNDPRSGTYFRNTKTGDTWYFDPKQIEGIAPASINPKNIEFSSVTFKDTRESDGTMITEKKAVQLKYSSDGQITADHITLLGKTIEAIAEPKFTARTATLKTPEPQPSETPQPARRPQLRVVPHDEGFQATDSQPITKDETIVQRGRRIFGRQPSSSSLPSSPTSNSSSNESSGFY